MKKTEKVVPLQQNYPTLLTIAWMIFCSTGQVVLFVLELCIRFVIFCLKESSNESNIKYQPTSNSNIKYLPTSNSNIKYLPTSEIVKKVNYRVDKNVPKCRTDVVSNFGKDTDVNISFVMKIQEKYVLSKGLATYERKDCFTSAEWEELNHTQLRSIKVVSLNGMPPTFIIGWGMKDDLLWLLEDLHRLKRRPFVIGVDCFNYVNFNSFSASEFVLFNAILKKPRLNCVFYYLVYNIQMEIVNKSYEPVNTIGSPYDRKSIVYFEGETKEEKCLNSMIELRYILQNSDNENAVIYKQILGDTIDLNNTISDKSMEEIIRRNMNIYDNSEKQFLSPAVVNYEMGFCLENGGAYVRFKKSSRTFNTSERFILVSMDTRLMLNSFLFKAIKRVSLSKFKVPNVKWCDGVPGSGKTEMIVLQHNPESDLVLTETKASIANIRERVLSKYGESVESSIDMNYKTVCSYVINYYVNRRRYNKVFIDEAIAMHSGYLGYISILSECSDIIIFGDSKQIPYIERSPIDIAWSNVYDISSVHEHASISNRCPIDVCYALSNHYTGIATNNGVVRSILPTVRKIEYDRIEPNTLVLTFTQREKYIVVNARKWPQSVTFHTVHEAQGTTYRNVVLIRMNDTYSSIYKSTPHSIVALSRHTETFRYLTLGRCDAVQTLINKVKYINDIDLTKWNLAQKERIQ